MMCLRGLFTHSPGDGPRVPSRIRTSSRSGLPIYRLPLPVTSKILGKNWLKSWIEDPKLDLDSLVTSQWQLIWAQDKKDLPHTVNIFLESIELGIRTEIGLDSGLGTYDLESCLKTIMQSVNEIHILKGNLNGSVID